MSQTSRSLTFKLISLSIVVALVAAAGVGTLLSKFSEDEAKNRLMQDANIMAQMVLELCGTCEIDSQIMQDALLAAKLDRAGSLWVINEDGLMLAKPDPRITADEAREFGNNLITLTSVRQPMTRIGEKDLGSRVPLKQVLGKYEEGTGLVEMGDETRVVAFISIPGKRWVIGVDEPFASLSAQSETIKRFILLTVVVLALCIVLSTALLTTFLIKPYYQQRIALTQEVEAANNKLLKLNELSVGMQKRLDLNQRMQDVLVAACEVVEIDRMFLFLPIEKGTMLQCQSAVGYEDALIEEIRVPVGAAGGAIGRAYAHGETFTITRGFVPEDLRLQPPYSEIKALRSREFVALPLIVEDEIVGVVTADNQLSKISISEQEIGLLKLFVGHAAVAIKNANMVEKLKAHADAMEVTDYLTKTFSHEYFLDLVLQALAKVESTEAPLSMGAISLSSLAEFNRQNGHNRGDRVITKVVATIKGHCDEDMVVGRCFGSTFAILFIGRDEIQARDVMTVIMDDVSSQDYPGEEKLQQGKMQFNWEVCQYRMEGEKDLSGFISGVLLSTRPDMCESC